MTTRDDDRSGLLMLSAVTATCHDCGEETLLVPAGDDERGDTGEFCCTACDAAVWLVAGLCTAPSTLLASHPRSDPRSRVA